MSYNLTPLYVKGIDENIHVTIAAYEAGWKPLFHIHETQARYIDHQTWEGYQLPQARFPGGIIASGQFKPSFNKHFVIRSFGLQDQFPFEDIEDDLYGVIHRMLPAKGGLFAQSFMDLMEIDTSNLLSIQGFASGSNVAGSPDGVSLFSSAHPISVSQPNVLWSNRSSINVDMSIAGAQAAETALRLQKAPNNITVLQNELDLVWFNPALKYIAQQVWRGQWEVGTADRNENFLRKKNVRLHAWPYWNKSGAVGTNNAWAALGKKHHLHFFMRQGVRTKTQSDIATNSEIIASTVRFDEGWTDPRGTWASNGL